MGGLKNKNKLKKGIIIGLAIALVVTAIVLFTLSRKNVDNQTATLDAETLKAYEYTELTDDDAKTESDCVQFTAFFTRDLDENGYAEKYNGTCKAINATDTLYMDINVLTEGYLENGKITLNAENFTWTTSIVGDSIVSGNYIGTTTEINLQDQVSCGSQKLLYGTIKSAVGNNINNYSAVSSVTLTGTHVAEDGTRTEINKIVNLTVDWYGITTTKVSSSSYNSQKYDIDKVIGEDEVTLTFNAYVSETASQLLLQKQVAEVTIPDLNGYSPTSVTVSNSGVTYEYDEGTRILTITKQAVVDDNGNITTSVSRTNIYSITVTYPLEAYTSVENTSIVLNIGVTGYNYGYNNPDTKYFDNPYVSSANTTITATWGKEQGEIWNLYVYVGDYAYYKNSYRYIVSKENALDIYNGNEQSTVTEYPVKWQLVVGDYESISTVELQEQTENEVIKTDKFLDSSSVYTSMYDYVKTTGIYFNNATNIFGEDGWIKLYNAETDELIETFTSETWGNYTVSKPYSVDVKSIKVEASSPVANGSFYVYQVKEIDNELLTTDFSKEQFDALSYIYTYLNGKITAPDGITYDTGTNTAELNKSNFAYYLEPYSNATISVSPSTSISNQETNNVNFVIKTTATSALEQEWKNGVFLIELPDDIINIDINSVICSDENVKISSYETYEKNGVYYILIYTENDEESVYSITVDADITANPLEPTKTQSVKLYAYNEYCDNYVTTATDVYDIDTDGLITDNVGYSTTSMSFIAPSGLLTTEYITNYDEEGNTTIAPNVAEIDKSDNSKTATINVSVTNNYSGTISEIKILGSIPFEGNTYFLNGGSLKSEFTTYITGAITVPEALQSYVTIYYSTNENPTKDLDDESNEWVLESEITDWSTIKTYLIDFGDYVLAKGENEVFTYEVEVPAGLGYNTVSYSDHAVYYNLDTENGKLTTKTEPNKVGLKVVRKFNLEITKYKLNSNATIAGVTYLLTYSEKDTEGEIQTKTRTLTTGDNGTFTLNNLYAGIEYILKEIKVPSTCELNSEEITFILNEDGTIEMSGNVKSYEFTDDETLKISLENEVTYNLQINKTKTGSSVAISGARFVLQDESGNKTTERTTNGIAIFEELHLNKQYTLTETVAPSGFEVDDGTFTFKLVRNDNNEIVIETIENTLLSGTPTVQDTDDVLTPVVNVQVENELKYSLNLIKQDLDGNKIGGVEFTITGDGLGTDGIKYTTSSEGIINISGLYIGRTYTIEETKSIGYYLDSSLDNTIQFKVDRSGGNLVITTWTVGDGVNQYGTQTIVEEDLTATLSVILQNEAVPTYSLKLIKENDEEEILPGAQFTLTSEDTGIEQTVTINENGEAILEGLFEYVQGKCITGVYTLKEMYAPEGYTLDTTELKFKASRDATGTLAVTVLEGDSIIKVIYANENDETGSLAISSDKSQIEITVVNKPIFVLTKYGDSDKLLPNAKFAITDLDGNEVTGADGEIISELVTNEKGQVTANLTEGLYKIVETEAPEGYVLADDEDDRTWYIGIGASQVAQTSGEIDAIEWAKQVSSKLGSEYNDVVATTDGGLIAVGTTYENIDIDGDRFVDSEEVGNKDGIIVKYDTDGNIVWSKIVGGINADELFAITKIPTGGYAVVGYSETSNVYYDGQLINVANYGAEDGILIKIDENGNYVWSQSIGGTGTDRINDVTATSDGSIAVVGSFYGTINMDNEATEQLGSITKKDGFISVYSSNGTYMWSEQIMGTGYVYGQSIATTNSGFVVGANSVGMVMSGSHELFSSAALLICYDFNGNFCWYKQIDSTANGTISDLIATSDGEQIIVSGGYGAEISDYGLTTVGLYDGMIIRFNADGTYVSSYSIGGTQDETISTIYETADGGILFGGWYYSDTVDIGKTGTNEITSLSGENDGIIAKLSADNELEWFDTIKGTSYDQVNAVVQLADEKFVAVGSFMSTSLSAMDNSEVLTNSTYENAFAIKYGESITDPEVPELQEISVTNELQQFYITTEVAENNDGKRTGGTITGVYSDAYPESKFIRFVETVKYGYDSTKEIVMTPDTGYEIVKITINNEEISYTTNSDGTYTIPAGYFENVQQDYHIVVTYVAYDQMLTLIKVDENDSSKLLEGAVFTITSVDDDSYNETFTTNEYGQIKAELTPGNYQITEITAPEGYILDSTSVNITMVAGQTNTVTITNEQQSRVIVHHYYKESDGTYTTNKVAEDEIYIGEIGEEYTTSPHVDLTDVTLEKDQTGTYVIPSNATGNYAKDVIEVTYYYEASPIKLTIHHYLEGTEDKLVDDETIETDAVVTFADDGTYTVTASAEYTVAENNNYNNLINEYNLTGLESTIQETVDLTDTLKYETTSELTYYYAQKSYEITTEVKEHTENRTNSITNEKEETQVKGGTISGEDETPYETVAYGKTSVNEIKITPDDYYTIGTITLESTNEDGTVTTTVIYGEGASLESEIGYTENADGTITLDYFTNVTENKHIIVEFEPIMGTVIVHHYFEGTGEEYGTDPIRVPSQDGGVVDDEIKSDYVGENYATKQSENVAEFLGLVKTSGQTSGQYVEEEIHVYYYYNYKDYSYTVEYYYDGVQDEDLTDEFTATYNDIISSYKDKVKDGYALEHVTPVDSSGNVELVIGTDPTENVIRVYYRTQYKITTDVIEHTETFKDGTVEENVKGGNISGEDETPYEYVFKYDDNTKSITIVPDTDYEIVQLTITDGTEKTSLDISSYIDSDGAITLPEGYFENMQADKHIEVEFRRKTNIVVQYLEKGTNTVLWTSQDGTEYETQAGYESQEYTTSRKEITYYQPAEVEAVKNGETVTATATYDAEGNTMTAYNDAETHVMYADTVTITYWYERIPSGIVVKHVEIDEDDIAILNESTDQEELLSLGTELDSETISGYVSLTEKTERNVYESYISVDGPVSSDENMVIVDADEDDYTVTYKEGVIVEIRYYYEKQYQVTTEVKPHTEIINGVERSVAGGTISGEGDTPYEIINKMGYNLNEIVITPEDGYRIKSITIKTSADDEQGLSIDLTTLTSQENVDVDGYTVTLQSKYFDDVDENKHVVVEFERIPAKVIVKYKDKDTGEEIIEDKIVNGYVNDEYDEDRAEIDSYIAADPEPENSEGIMTEDDITIIYWYTKQFKITTDVIEHFEVKDDVTVSVKGGTITGEDETPYETVNRGKDSTLAITITPDDGYRIKEITINGKTLDYENDNKIVKNGYTVEIPVAYFTNMQENKHITVEYENIDTKVTVKYVDNDTSEEISERTEIDGNVNDEYKTEPKDIDYYELVEEKYPENSEGIMTEDEIIVIYYYRKLPFNFKLEKEIFKITLNGSDITAQLENNKKADLDIKYEDIDEIDIKVTYKIKVTNTEKISGTATIQENIPEGFTFVSDQSDENWKLVNDVYEITTTEIEPEQTAEYIITLKWNNNENNKGSKTNTAKINTTENKPNFAETTLDDNEDTATVKITLVKTVSQIIEDAVTTITQNVKTGDPITISILSLTVAGVVLCIEIMVRKRRNKED